MVIYSLQGERLTLTLVRLAPRQRGGDRGSAGCQLRRGDCAADVGCGRPAVGCARSELCRPCGARHSLRSSPSAKARWMPRALTRLPMARCASSPSRTERSSSAATRTTSLLARQPCRACRCTRSDGYLAGQQLLLQGGDQAWLLDLAEGRLTMGGTSSGLADWSGAAARRGGGCRATDGRHAQPQCTSRQRRCRSPRRARRRQPVRPP